MVKGKTKYIFISGGVISGIGKGIVASSIGMLLKQRGFSVDFIKCDPYFNVDAGTMNPIEHGEVFVTEDGFEIDMDGGHYERFTDQPIKRYSGMTSGQIFLSVIEKERKLEYGGACVDLIPHVRDEILLRFQKVVDSSNPDVLIVEIGGTVGEYKNAIYYEAERHLKRQVDGDLIHIHVAYLPIPKSLGEMKSKPAQLSVTQLNSMGIFPNILIGRSEKSMDAKRRDKLAISSGIDTDCVFSEQDTDNIYKVPLILHEQGIDDSIMDLFHWPKDGVDIKAWEDLFGHEIKPEKIINIGIVGKYFNTGEFEMEDSYASVIESIKHACWNNKVGFNLKWISAEDIEKNGIDSLKDLQGIIVPGGFGERGIEGKILSVQYARENKIPYLGLCYGMQMATIEFARNILGLKDANTQEINPNTSNPVIHLISDQEKKLLAKDYGASMRLGNWPCVLKTGTIAQKAYGKSEIQERHRHRYEFNNKYREDFEKNGFIISGISPEGELVEIVELDRKLHPFFVGVQFHPEFLSRPLKPHPLFNQFVKSASC